MSKNLPLYCPNCGVIFSRKKSNQVFCSTVCEITKKCTPTSFDKLQKSLRNPAWESIKRLVPDNHLINKNFAFNYSATVKGNSLFDMIKPNITMHERFALKTIYNSPLTRIIHE